MIERSTPLGYDSFPNFKSRIAYLHILRLKVRYVDPGLAERIWKQSLVSDSSFDLEGRMPATPGENLEIREEFRVDFLKE